MRRLWLLLFCASVHAQTLYLSTPNSYGPKGSTLTETAIVTGVNDKTVVWSITSGTATLVGTNPCVLNEPCTIGVLDTNVEAVTLKATSNANSSVTATATLNFTASPTPISTNPKFLMPQSMLAALQAKATSGNLMYQSMVTNSQSYFNTDNNTSAWGRTGSTGWTCAGGNGQPATSQVSAFKEVDAFYYAFMALIVPTGAPTGAPSGCHWPDFAHDVSIYYMTAYTASPPAANEWSDASTEMALTPDWLLGSGAVTTSGDKTVLRNFLQAMATTVLNYGPAQNPASAYNSSAMFNTSSASDFGNFRFWGGNNYMHSRDLYVLAAGLTFNDNTTDAPNNATGAYNTCGATRYVLCSDFTGGSLIAFWKYYDGAMLYDWWAHISDPNVVWQAYEAAYSNLPTQPQCKGTDTNLHPCFGDGRDGESAEGSWYQYSMYRDRYAMNMLHTAGMDDPLLYGPQMNAVSDSWWDLKYISDLEFLTSQQTYSSVVLPSYNYLTTGDSNSYTRLPSDFWTQASILAYDSYTGRTDRNNALEWSIYNMAWGGPKSPYTGGCVSQCGFDAALANNNNSGVMAVDLFIALPAGDPVATLPTDPRSSLPTDLYAASANQHAMVRDNFSSTGTLWSYWFNNTQISHEYTMAGRFDVFSKGEYITKGRTIFNDYNWFMLQAQFQNIPSLLNSNGSGCSITDTSCTYYPFFGAGGEMPQGSQLGQYVGPMHSELPTYAAVSGITTNDYNGSGYIYGPWGTYTDITSASRDMVYLRSLGKVVYYDRATVGHSASTQSLALMTTGTPTISGSTATWLTPSSTQKAAYTTVLPSGATLANAGLPCPNCNMTLQNGDWEIADQLTITPSGTPTSTQFLSVLEWGSSSFTPLAISLVQSLSGQNFDGACLNDGAGPLVMFMRTPATLTGTTFAASGATTIYVSDLTPNTSYPITGTGTPASAISDNAGVLTFSATGTGNITIGTPSSTSVTLGHGVTLGAGTVWQ